MLGIDLKKQTVLDTLIYYKLMLLYMYNLDFQCVIFKYTSKYRNTCILTYRYIVLGSLHLILFETIWWRAKKLSSWALHAGKYLVLWRMQIQMKHANGCHRIESCRSQKRGHLVCGANQRSMFARNFRLGWQCAHLSPSF